MSRTFRRKNFSLKGEALYVGWELEVHSKDGVCYLSEDEQEHIIQRDFYRFHSDGFKLENYTYWYRLSNKLYRKRIRQAIKKVFRETLEEEASFPKLKQTKQYGVW